MPIKKASFKALRQTKKRTVRNRTRKEKTKDLRKKIQKFLAAKNIEEAKKLMPLFYKSVDKAAKTQVITKNKASRLKARLMAQLQKTQSK
jgi:small subunit ribosomal protein S20